MAAVTPPEILRSSLLSAVLQLKSLPLQVDVLSFDFLDKPTVSHLLKVPFQIAYLQLFLLGRDAKSTSDDSCCRQPLFVQVLL
jgi:hypothetical protein